MKLDSFKNKSTFTWFGRHASELKFLLRSMGKAPETVLEIGSGCIEPIYLAQMLPETSTVYAVDLDKSICDALDRIVSGEELPLDYIAQIACNKEDDGTPRENRDLTSNLLDKGFEELQMAGLDPKLFIVNGI